MQLFFATLVFVGITIQINAANIKCGQTPIRPNVPPEPGNFESRIVGGTLPIPNYWPWQILLLWTNGTMITLCGGTVIAEQWILTAAHCLNSKDPRDSTVYVGVQKHSDPGPPLYVQEIYDHPQYDPTNGAHDIKLIKLASPIEYSDHVQPVCLPFIDDDIVVPPNTAWATGWGATTDEGTDNDDLLEVNVPFVDFDTCVEKLKGVVDPPRPLDGTLQVCAGGNVGTGICRGDSGGPLVVKSSDGSWFQYGIVSGGEKCGDTYPAVFTRVSGYCNWIESTTNGDAACQQP